MLLLFSVSFKPVTMNGTCYTAVCGTGDDSDEKECSWRLHASIPKNSGGYLRIKVSYECIDVHADTSIQS